jgi:hypothetical protein
LLAPPLGLGQPGEASAVAFAGLPDPPWRHGYRHRLGVQWIEGARYLDWPFDWHVHGWPDAPYLVGHEAQLQAFITQDRLVRFALWSEQANPLTGAVREVSHEELLNAVRFSGVRSWFVHNPRSPHCGTCVFTGTAHWLACHRCAALRLEAYTLTHYVAGEGVGAGNAPGSDSTETFNTIEAEHEAAEYERQERHQELNTCFWYDDALFDQDSECVALRLLTEWAERMSRSEALEPIYTPGDDSPAYMAENGIPPFDPDTDIVSPFEEETWDEYDWYLHSGEHAVEEAILQHSIIQHRARWDHRRADNIAAHVCVVETYLHHWRRDSRCSHPGPAGYLPTIPGLGAWHIRAA